MEVRRGVESYSGARRGFGFVMRVCFGGCYRKSWQRDNDYWPQRMWSSFEF